jgi:MFS transporter, DHA1 family, inner membrane transport protein
VVGLLLAGAALAYMPGNFLARRWVDTHARPLLISLALGSAALVGVLGGIRAGVAASFGVFAVLAFASGGRTIAGSAYGLDAAPEEKVVVMSLRAAALQFGYLIGAALGGVALGAWGYAGLGAVLAALYVAAAVPHVVSALIRSRDP